MTKFVKKFLWWVFTILLIVTGALSFLLLKGIDWVDPEEGWDPDWDKDDKSHG